MRKILFVKCLTFFIVFKGLCLSPAIDTLPYNDGSFEKLLNGTARNIKNITTVVQGETFRLNCIFNSDQYSASDVQKGDLFSSEFIGNMLYFHIDSVWDVSGSELNLQITLGGDQSFNLPFFQATSAQISRTTDKGLLLVASGTSEQIRNRTINASLIRIDSLLNTSVTSSTIETYDAGNGFWVTGSRGITMTYQGSGTGDYTFNVPSNARFIDWYKYFTDHPTESDNGTINITYNFNRTNIYTSRANGKPPTYQFVWWEQAGQQYPPRNNLNGKNAIGWTVEHPNDPVNGTIVSVFTFVTGEQNIGLIGTVNLGL